MLAQIENAELPYVHAWMTRHADHPMDFADATIVYLAKREALSTIFTVDHSEFDTDRIDEPRRFNVLPSARPEQR